MKTRSCVLLVGLLGLSSALQAGVVFQVETTYHTDSSGSQVSEMSVDGEHLKMEVVSGNANEQEGEAVFLGDRRQMMLINHSDREYIVVDESTVQKLGGQINQAMKEMEQAMAQMDPAQRAMVEQMMKQGMGRAGMPGMSEAKKPVMEYRRTGDQQTKGGYPCVKYEVLKDGQKVRELWVTDWGNVEGGSEFRKVFLDMAAFWQQLHDAFSSASGVGAGFFGMHENPMEGFAKANGFPVVSREFRGGTLESESVLKSATPRDLRPDAFEPPAGYQLRKIGPK